MGQGGNFILEDVREPSEENQRQNVSRRLYFQPHRPHQFQSVTFAHDPWTHPIVKHQLTVLQVIFEVHIGRSRSQSLSNMCQGQIMRRDKSESTVIDQTADDRLGSNAAIMRVGALENFIEQKKQRQWSASKIREKPQTRNLGV